MVVSYPPGRTTAARQARLRRRVTVAILASLLPVVPSIVADNAALAAQHKSGPLPPTILVHANVADRARSSMPESLWTRFVSAYAGASSVPLQPDATADAAGCRAAAGDYLVSASFDVRDDLPGMPNASDRLPGRARVAVIACADGRVLADRAVRIDGDPVPPAEAGTVDALSDAWKRAVPAGLATTGVAIGRIARTRRLESGGGLFTIDVLFGSIPTAAILTDVARANDMPRRPPIRLTVTRATPASVDAIFAQTREADPAPSVGDTIEYGS